MEKHDCMHRRLNIVDTLDYYLQELTGQAELLEDDGYIDIADRLRNIAGDLETLSVDLYHYRSHTKRKE